MARGRQKTTFSPTFIKPIFGKVGKRPEEKRSKDIGYKQLQAKLNVVNRQIETINRNISNFDEKGDRTSLVKSLLSNRVKDTLISKKDWIENTMSDMKKGKYFKGRIMIIQRYDMALKNQRGVITQLKKKTFEAKNDMDTEKFNYLLEKHSDLFYSSDQVVKGLETIINRDGKYQDLLEWDTRMEGHTLTEFSEWLQATQNPSTLFQTFYNHKDHKFNYKKFEELLSDYLYDIKRGNWPLK